MNLTEIKQYSRDARKEIRGIAESIHPKLLKILRYEDIYDSTLNDDRLQLRYNTDVYPLVLEYQRKMKELKYNYIDQYFSDILELDSDFELGIDLRNGTSIYKATAWREADDFLPAPEVEYVYNSVIELHNSEMNIRCFWEYHTVNIISSNKVYSASSTSTPTRYIEQCIQAFGNKKTNAIQTVFNLTKKASEIGYDIHLPPLSQYEEQNILASQTTQAITLHLKLKDFIDGEHDKSKESYRSQYDEAMGVYKFYGRDY